MQGAALGLTCKDAFQVFSQNETFALQAKVKELKALLAHHRPPITHAADKIKPGPLLDMVCDMFDKIHSRDSRLAPVLTEDEAYDPLCMRSIWAAGNYHLQDDGLAQNSLQAVIMQVLKNALGDLSADYCETQSYYAIEAVQRALRGGYDASGWDIFSEPQLQENIVWQAIDDYFFKMQVELDEWDNQACWF
jgi:hypothetical protein